MKTIIKLLSWTQNPIETIYCEWMGSRAADFNHTPEDVHFEEEFNPPLRKEVSKVFQDVIDMKIPVSETIHFVFQADHVPIALREQWVRHRVVHKFGSQIGADIIPDIHESTWWSQTMRVLNMGHFAQNMDYLIPESLAKCGKAHEPLTVSEAEERYYAAMYAAEDAYNDLVELGVPIEDARNVLPLAVQHRLCWSTNLSSLMHLLSKRGCWIAQLGMWEPIIVGIVEELSSKIDPYFRRLIDPPCIGKNGEFETCRFKLENENRIVGEDPYPPCSLYLHNDSAIHKRLSPPNEDSEMFLKPAQIPVYNSMKEKYAKLWMRDPISGERKAVL